MKSDTRNRPRITWSASIRCWPQRRAVSGWKRQRRSGFRTRGVTTSRRGRRCNYISKRCRPWDRGLTPIRSFAGSPFLDPRKDMGAVERARFLHFHTSAYMTRAYGASNEFARAAAERARDQLARFTRPGAGVEIAPMDLLKWLHPERLDFVDSAAASELGGEARKCASAVGFPLPQGVNLLLILMFIFGAEVASDPLYHWVGELLQGPEPGADRLNNLVDRTKEHLAAILAASKEVAS